MSGLMRLCFFGLLFVASCAPANAYVDGKQIPRLDMDFVGQPFVVRVSAAHPKPGSPSGGLRDFGGRLSGNICGLDVTYDIQHEGDHTHLTGFIDEQTGDSKLDVKDVEGVSRQIYGTLDTRSGTGMYRGLPSTRSTAASVVGQVDQPRPRFEANQSCAAS